MTSPRRKRAAVSPCDVLSGQDLTLWGWPDDLPRPIQEYRFAPPRLWRFDYAMPAVLVAVELEGGVWTGGRHTRGAGFLRDCQKYNCAAVIGWAVLRFPPGDRKRGQAPLRNVDWDLVLAAVTRPKPRLLTSPCGAV